MILAAGYVYRDELGPNPSYIYLYLGDRISVEFVKPEEWQGQEAYIGSRLILGGTIGFEECQEIYHSGWIKNSSGCLPVLYSGQPPEALCSLDDVMDWICSLTPEDFDGQGCNMILPWAAVQLSGQFVGIQLSHLRGKAVGYGLEEWGGERRSGGLLIHDFGVGKEYLHRCKGSRGTCLKIWTGGAGQQPVPSRLHDGAVGVCSPMPASMGDSVTLPSSSTKQGMPTKPIRRAAAKVGLVSRNWRKALRFLTWAPMSMT